MAQTNVAKNTIDNFCYKHYNILVLLNKYITSEKKINETEAYLMTLGKKMKLIRVKNDLTQAELSEKMKVTQTFISQLERNVLPPTKMYIALFCYVFNISEAELFEEVA